MENRLSQISMLPVIDSESKAVGIVRLHDIVRSGLCFVTDAKANKQQVEIRFSLLLIF